MFHFSFSKKSIFFFSLLLTAGFFGWGEKSWGVEKCGTDKKGTCEIAEGTTKSDCPAGLTPYSYDPSLECSPIGWEKTVCCISEEDICKGKKEGDACEKNNKQGTCINGKCITEAGKEGEKCGDEQGICLTHAEASSKKCSQDFGGRDCEIGFTCCKISSLDSSCGNNNGICSSNCSASQKEDTAGASTCSAGMKCCYYDASTDTKEVSFGYDNPLLVESFSAWASQLLTSIQGVVGWLAVIMIMIGGMVYLTSAGTNQATLGKEIISVALIGFAVVVAGPSLLKEIKNLISSSGGTPASIIDNAKDIKSIITSILNFLLIAMGTLALIGITTGGIFYLTAFGDKSKAETGKKIVINALYAIALSGGGLILVNQILNLLKG